MRKAATRIDLWTKRRNRLYSHVAFTVPSTTYLFEAMSYLRNWFSLATAAPPPQVSTQTTTIPGSFAEEEEEDGSTTPGEEDVPPAFPALNSAQRATPSSSTPSASHNIPTILNDDALMPPPPLPDLTSRQPGVPRTKPQIASSSLLAPMATTERPKKPSRKVALAPGYGPLDWANLKASGQDLRVRLLFISSHAP